MTTAITRGEARHQQQMRRLSLSVWGTEPQKILPLEEPGLLERIFRRFMSQQVEVIQADKEAAYRWFGFKAEQRLTEIEKGEVLKMGLFLARHRVTHSPSPAEAGQETVEQVADLKQIAAQIRFNGAGKWWASLTDTHRKALKSGNLSMMDEAFEAGAIAALSRPSTEAEALAKVQKVRDSYASQAKFCDIEALGYFREFIRRIDEALAAYRSTTGAPQVKEGGDA